MLARGTRIRLVRLATAVWTALVAAGSLLRNPPVARAAVRLPGADLTLHALIYAVLCVLVFLSTPRLPLGRRLAAAVGLSLAFGLALECLQPLTGRVFAAGDLLANAAGALAGAAAVALLARRPP
ncbi:MAG: hypothetical protein AMK73_06340 [Planctomycetes bacterium SM23_32]|nr:MAG: hypothetical protein AMK73_06340 [Planctomycetes bacterium SM23_32]